MKSYYEVIVSGLALATAIGGGYVAVATRATPAEVEHIVEIKSVDKFGEILRRLERIDQRLDRLEQKP